MESPRQTGICVWWNQEWASDGMSMYPTTSTVWSLLMTLTFIFIERIGPLYDHIFQ